MPRPRYDPRSPAVRADPYPLYHALLDEDPVQHVPTANLWIVARHEDCLTVLRDRRFSARHGQQLRRRQTSLPVSMLNSDPPEHTRLRRAVAPAFGRQAIQACGSWLPGAVDRQLRQARAAGSGGEVDVVADFAVPLAAQVLARFLGLPDEDVPRFAAWGGLVSEHLDPFGDPDPHGPSEAAMDAMLDRFADELHARTRSPRPDAFGVLARAYTDGLMTPPEVMGAAALLVVGGFQPLADMIGNALAGLLSEPAGQGLLRPGTALAAAVGLEELLRWDAPIQFTARTALEDVVLGGHVLRSGEGVVTLLGAANRDGSRFPEPDRLVPDRRPNPHLSFGAGRHACAGAPLARLVGKVVISAVRERLPALGPGTSPTVRRHSLVPRGYQYLPVRCGPA